MLTYIEGVLKDTLSFSPALQFKSSAMTFSFSLLLLVLAVWEVDSSAFLGKSARGRSESESSALRLLKREGGWTYGSGNNGVDHWNHLYGSCAGYLQSPININTDEVVFDGGLGDFTFDDSDAEEVILKVVNDGHTVKGVYQQGDITLHSPGLAGNSVYKVANFHFHWGSTDGVGSEHMINGKTFSMEMHIVTWNTAYGTMENAMTHPDGLAVLAFLFEVSGYDNPIFSSLIKMLNGIQNPDNEEDMQVFPLINLLQNGHRYYRYQGGLTTPPCTEVVQWTIFSETIRISKSQMNAFRNLKTTGQSGAEPLVNNYRPVQPINDRKVEANFKS